ncbi:MAG: peptidyl-prolyl cis-trans isomerase [marine bacterium B5-7]|nr:MAG: peptidyl-prolyl cis-trans isomerase [marine bacterium B5-7]
MSQAKSGDTVRVHYTGKLDDGTQFDTSVERDPLKFELGSGQLINGFDVAVEGMQVGENKTVRIEADDAYGQRDEQLLQNIPKDALPEDLNPSVGMPLQAQGPDGQTVKLLVVAVEDETITVDGNNPLAGEALTFDIELVEIV